MQTVLVLRVDVSSSHLLSLAVLAISSPKPVAVVVAIPVDDQNLGFGATRLYFSCWIFEPFWFALAGLGTGSGRSEPDRSEPVWLSGPHGEGGYSLGVLSVAGGWDFSSL